LKGAGVPLLAAPFINENTDWGEGSRPNFFGDWVSFTMEQAKP
jgi:hypothetical protein